MMSAKSVASGVSTVKVLLTDTNRWAISARLAIGLNEAGCEVSAICPAPNHALMKTRAVQRTFRYNPYHPLEALDAAILAVDPDIIVPSCDRSVAHLHELYVLRKSQGEAGQRTAELIERSLGSPSSYSIVSSRYDLLALARDEGIRVPNMSRIRNAEELESWRANEPFPWVLKADGTWGGGGVRIIQSADGVEESFRQLAQMSRLNRAMKRLVVNRDPFWLRDWWNRSARPISAQSYIQGRPANCTVVCWNGQVLAGIGVEVARSEGATGPASVVCIVESAEMMNAAGKIASRLGLSGFFGLDFMIEEESKSIYLIEMNPRLAPPCHLRLGRGRDLAGALWSQLAGQPLSGRAPVTQEEFVAYFPEGVRSHHLPTDCFRDIPQGEPELVEELLRPYPDRTLLFRVAQSLTRFPFSAKDFEIMAWRGHDTHEDSKRNNQDMSEPTAIENPPKSIRASST